MVITCCCVVLENSSVVLARHHDDLLYFDCLLFSILIMELYLIIVKAQFAGEMMPFVAEPSW